MSGKNDRVPDERADEFWKEERDRFGPTAIFAVSSTRFSPLNPDVLTVDKEVSRMEADGLIKPRRAYWGDEGWPTYVRRYLSSSLPDLMEPRREYEMLAAGLSVVCRKSFEAQSILIELLQIDCIKMTPKGYYGSAGPYFGGTRNPYLDVVKCLDDIQLAVSALRHMDRIAKTKIESLRPYSGKGRPPVLWKVDFAYVVAYLWRNLTSALPSADPASRFATFLDSIWQSLSHDMPEENWDRAIRGAVERLRSEGLT